MALVKPVIFQIVGYQNSGKTTIMSKLIHRLSTEGLKVASIKHHGHGGEPEVAANKDSAKHLAAGAIASVAEGEGLLLLEAGRHDWTLEEQIQLLSFFNPDIILIEGYKKESYPKLLLVRNHNDLELITATDHVQAVITWEEVPGLLMNLPGGTPVFKITEKQAIDWIITYLANKL